MARRIEATDLGRHVPIGQHLDQRGIFAAAAPTAGKVGDRVRSLDGSHDPIHEAGQRCLVKAGLVDSDTAAGGGPDRRYQTGDLVHPCAAVRAASEMPPGLC
jgi:hypothetical protein